MDYRLDGLFLTTFEVRCVGRTLTREPDLVWIDLMVAPPRPMMVPCRENISHFALIYFALSHFALIYFALSHFALIYFALSRFALIYFALRHFALIYFALSHFALIYFALWCPADHQPSGLDLESVTLSVATPLCPYGIAYRRASGLSFRWTVPLSLGSGPDKTRMMRTGNVSDPRVARPRAPPSPHLHAPVPTRRCIRTQIDPSFYHFCTTKSI
jgi:hypothetical protein